MFRILASGLWLSVRSRGSMPESSKLRVRACPQRRQQEPNAWCLDTGQNIRKLVKDGFVIRKPQKIHSRSRARAAQEAKSKGRHTGYGTLLAMPPCLCQETQDT